MKWALPLWIKVFMPLKNGATMSVFLIKNKQHPCGKSCVKLKSERDSNDRHHKTNPPSSLVNID
ncbi:MAG TPA: hypothetical protein VNN20_12830 [Thermodesulfobacteriota bacterium]|nr:hypothetical protein [Thermodesulfobacteriota bacterium]